MLTYFTFDDLLARMKSFCVYRERCHSEVISKLYQLKAGEERAGKIISELIEEGFLNEERFARAYVSGKFRIKHWGKAKIMAGLKQKKVSAYCIRKGFEEIDQQEYLESLKILFHKKLKSLGHLDVWEKRKKMLSYLTYKGYERDLIWVELNGLE